MRLITTTHFTAAVLAVALTLPVASWAQTTTPTAPAVLTEATATTPPAGSRREKVEQRIADMHATLQITPEQEKQWDQFADVMLSNAQTMDDLLTRSAGKEATQSAEVILQGYADITQIHAQNVQKLSAAFNTLYTTLTSAQKATADAMFRATAARREQKDQNG